MAHDSPHSTPAVLTASRPWPFPTTGPRRVVAVSRLQEAIAADVVAQLDALAYAGWLDAADPDTVSIIAATWHGVVANAVSDALDRLRAYESGAESGECAICFAVIEQGKCWGCGEPPGRGVR